MDHGKLKWYILCPRRLQATQDDCAVRVQRLCSVLECAGKKDWISGCAETHLFPSRKI